MSTDPRRKDDHPTSSPSHLTVISMAIGFFFFILWLGVTLIEDNGRNSALISFALTVLFVFSLYRRPRGRRR